MYKISRFKLIEVVLLAQDNEDKENFPWLYALYSTGFKPEFKDEYSLESLDQNQMDILIEYLIKANSYGEDTDPQDLDDLILYDILTPVKKNAASVAVKGKKPKKG